MANTIQYYLVPNVLTPDPNDHYARVLTRGVLNSPDVIKRCLRRGTTLTETDITAAVNLYLEEAAIAVSEGYNVNTPLVNVRPSINGVFTSKSDSFDPSRHSIIASPSMGLGLTKAMKEARPEKVQELPASPYVLEYKDTNTASLNLTLTPGGIGNLTGSDLKFNPANLEEGIFIVAVAGGAATKVLVISVRTEGKLSFLVPAGLVAGNYRVEVRRAYTSANTIRTGDLPYIITVL